MKHLITVIALGALLSSCIPESAKQEINDQIVKMQEMMADQEFKNKIALIELHKTRFGSYPESLKDLKFLPAMDSASSFSNVEYTKLDSGYELNLTMKATTFSGTKGVAIKLKYPDEFWNGLGCVKSNMK
jgi:hypothetical protein